MNGLIVINGYFNIESQTHQTYRFIEEFKKRNVDVDVIDTTSLIVYTDNKPHLNINKNYDFCLYLDKDKYVAKILEDLGIRVFNNSKGIDICDDKMLTHIELAKHNITMPKTIPAPLCFVEGCNVSNDYIKRIEEQLNYPLIVKESYGSLGKNVYLINNREELIKITNSLINKEHLYQEFIKTSKGKDIRVICVNNKVVASMLRHNDNDFRSNAALGGDCSAIQLSDEYRKIAEKTATILNLDYCGIDILIGENNKPLICEVNSKAFFKKIEEVCKVNIAGEVVEYIIQILKK